MCYIFNMEVKINTITLTLTKDEAYALCNKLDDESLFTHGGFCEFDQIKLLQKIGKALGGIVGHHSSKNDLSVDVVSEVHTRNKK